MHPVLFTIGDLAFYTHGLLAVAGIILGSFVAFYFANKKGLSTKLFFDNIVFTVLFGIIGARLTYFFLYREQFSSIKEVFYLWDGGLVSYGGFVLGSLTLLILLVKQNKPVKEWFDIISIGFFLGLFIGRIGDLFAGEFNGVHSDYSIKILEIYNVVPVSLYEAILCLCIFVTMLFVYSKKKNKLISGVLTLLSIVIYSLGRFILDFWRTESSIVLGLSIGQLFGLMLALFAIFLLFRLLSKERRADEIK